MDQYIVLVRHERTNPDKLYDASVTRVTHETSKRDDPVEKPVVIREHEDGWDLATVRGAEGLLPGGWLYCCQAETDELGVTEVFNVNTSVFKTDGIGLTDVFNVNTFVFDETEAYDAATAALCRGCKDGFTSLCSHDLQPDWNGRCTYSSLAYGVCPHASQYNDNGEQA